jgi:hypothetical protein
MPIVLREVLLVPIAFSWNCRRHEELDELGSNSIGRVREFGEGYVQMVALLEVYATTTRCCVDAAFFLSVTTSMALVEQWALR